MAARKTPRPGAPEKKRAAKKVTPPPTAAKAARRKPTEKSAPAANPKRRTRNLRVVAPDEVPEPEPQPKKKAPVLTIVAAAAEESPRELLVAMRNRIAKTLDEPNCPARDQASLSRRLLEIRKEIEALDAAAEQEAAESVVTEDEAFDASTL